MPTLDRPYCHICASPGAVGVCSWCREHSPAVDAIRAPFLYTRTSPIHRAITSLKYEGMKALAPDLSAYLADCLERHTRSFEIVVPVPSHPSRVRSRGYSQAGLIAENLAARIGVPIRPTALERVSNAPSQLETESREGRWTNVMDGFEARIHLNGETVLLVDDLVTTGSTASACASALKKAGAGRVVALAVARTT